MNKKIFNTAFTMGATHVNRLYLQRIAFTMAEILLSLTIIGVVAAITLPSLTGNINERTWDTQRKALYARMSQAIALMGSINGYGQYAGTWSDDTVDVTVDTAAQTFVTDGLKKVLKLNNICDTEHYSDCGISSTFTTMTNEKRNFPKKLSELNPMFTSTLTWNMHYRNPQSHIDTKAVAFETANGESIVVFYNPYCSPTSVNSLYKDVDTSTTTYTRNEYIWKYMCANFVFDLNGKKGPNTVGKDIGTITALYATDSSVVAPMPVAVTVRGKYNEVNALCSSQNENWRAPNIEEIMALMYNNELYNIKKPNLTYAFQSSTLASPIRAWTLTFHSGIIIDYLAENSHNANCIKR